MAVSGKAKFVRLACPYSENFWPRRAPTMTPNSFASIAVHFATLEDPRVARSQRHPLINVIVIGLCAVICGARHFTQMEVFGQNKRTWLAKFLDLKNGIPSHDVFNAVFACLKPEQFEACLLSWITSLHEVTEGQVLAIDGKTLRGSYQRGDGKAAVHMVSVWATANQLSLGSVTVEDKSNEITAIPRLLELIDVSGALVTIDAMGCQKEIAQKIVEQGGDYVLAVKDNQPKLHAAVTEFFEEQLDKDLPECRKRTTTDKGHGRQEQRTYLVAPVPEEFPLLEQWPTVKALGLALNVTERAGKETADIRYYILSTFPSARRFAEAVRGHWGIENNLHWQLDITFGEDDLRLHRGHGPVNMSILMRTALSLLKKETSKCGGIATKRLAAGWNEAYLEKVLMGK
jgi:predicted transposase YbfD/YdcC